MEDKETERTPKVLTTEENDDEGVQEEIVKARMSQSIDRAPEEIDSEVEEKLVSRRAGTIEPSDEDAIKEARQQAAPNSEGDPLPEEDREEATEDEESDAATEKPDSRRSKRGDSRSRGRRGSRSNPPSKANEIVLEYLVERSERAPQRLRNHLAGTVAIEILGSDRRYLIDWSSDKLSATDQDFDTNADCVIRCEEISLEQIASGKLNPQIAMLSDKLEVTGRAEMAMYFFNLLAPSTAA